MLTEATIQRIGGSTFARLPPSVVKSLKLAPGDTVQISIVKEGLTLNELLRRFKEHPVWVDPDWAKDRGVMSKVD